MSARVISIFQARSYGKAYRQMMAVVFHAAAKRAANPDFVALWRTKVADAAFMPTHDLAARSGPGPVDFTPDSPKRLTTMEIISGLLFIGVLIDAIPVGWW